MTPEPCPTCKGKCCCRVENGLPVPHSEATFYIRHVCPDCDDGTYEICSEPEPFVPPRTYEQGIAEGERRATARIVAWLREPSLDRACCKERVVLEADCIERGEHRREEEK